MDAGPILAEIAELLERHKLDAILIGNAAAALQGAPVTTIDIDFFFRRTPANVRKLKAIAVALGAVIFRPAGGRSPVWRLSRDRDGLQLDFMDAIDGVDSFEGLRERSTQAEIGGTRLLVAALADVIESKKAAGRPQDIAILWILEKVLEEGRNHRAENELAIHGMIRRRLAMPMARRTNFLRKRAGILQFLPVRNV